MKKLFLLFAFLLSCLTFAQDVYVRGYTKKDGTYVQPHYRTSPNSTINDNYSTVGNVNPYTGKQGTVPRKSSYNTRSTPSYQTPSTYSYPTYSSPSTSSSRVIHTGPRGGRYYINSNGNKTYVK